MKRMKRAFLSALLALPMAAGLAAPARAAAIRQLPGVSKTLAAAAMDSEHAAVAFYCYPSRVAWLGFMHRRRIASAVVYSATGSQTYAGSAQLDNISQRLKDITVLDCTACRANSLPEAVRGKTPTQTVTLAFDTGAIYNIAVYDGTYLTMEWGGDDRVFFYTLA